MARVTIDHERLLTPGEVGARFHVDPKTVARWETDGRITAIRTPGGHRRYREDEVMALLVPEAVTPDPLAAGVGALWPHQAASRLKLRLERAGIATVGLLVKRSAADLAAEGFRPPHVEQIRLALYVRGLALHGDVLDRKVA